jgi:hypothetical protein
MKTYLAAAVGLTSTLLLTSCVVNSVQPLASPDKAQADQRLVGIWRGKDGQLTTITSTQGAWLHVKTTGAPGSNEKPGDCDAFPTTIGNYTFLNVRTNGKDNRGNTTNCYFFIRYAISSNHLLRMWMMSQDAAVNAIRAGKLKGRIQPGLNFANSSGQDYDVTFTDSGSNLTKFIERSDVTALFHDTADPAKRVSN